jgi:Tfp pilus assembly protein PilF
MKKGMILLMLLVQALFVLAQEPDVAQLHETAKQFMRNGDWANSILVLNKALQKEPGNIAVQKDLALTYYYKRDFSSAREAVKPLVEREDADIQTYQIAGNIYKAIAEQKDAEKMYKKALKQYPESGALYAEYGELLAMMSESDKAIEQWETGIQKDAGYAGNYYYAARYYDFKGDKIWPLIYGEMFINMESYTAKTAEIKNQLLEGYKKFFTTDPKAKPVKITNEFALAFSNTLSQNSSVINMGINTGTLTMLRTRFILDWFKQHSAKFPFRLFEHQRQLLQEGVFDAYNQWIFEAAGNLAQYENWTKLNADQYAEFSKLQRSKLFKIPPGQYYQKTN